MSIIDKLKADKKLAEFAYKEQKLEFISTGVLTLNLLFSGRLDGGIPIGKVNMIAADSSLGKSFTGLKVVKNAQRMGMDCIFIDSEFSYDKVFAESIGIDTDKIFVYQNNQIEEIQNFIMKTFNDMPLQDRKNTLVIIDSWNAMVTSKTVDDSIEGKDVKDMTISIKKNTLAKLLTGLRTTIYVINQIYDSMDMYNPIAIPGGKGLYFASSSIVLGSSKAKNKETDGEVSGAIITASTKKSRICKENTKLKYLIKYEGGIHPVWGIDDDLYEFGFLLKPSMGWYQRDFSKLGLEGEDRKWRAKEMALQWKEFYGPIINNPTVKEMFEKKYTFEHQTIVDILDDADDIQITQQEEQNINESVEN